jgi:hypothetical protein
MTQVKLYEAPLNMVIELELWVNLEALARALKSNKSDLCRPELRKMVAEKIGALTDEQRAVYGRIKEQLLASSRVRFSTLSEPKKE